MSEQEKKSCGNIIGGSSMVMVEQTTANRHKPPYRPTELKEETLPDIQHKRSRAPAVPPVEEELKDSSDKPDIQDRMESERAISSDKQKHSIAQKLSLNTRRREVSPEAITLAPIEVERKRDAPKHLPQPIPAQVSTVALDAAATSGAEKVNENNDDNDSITEEIAELRTAEVAQKSSEWIKSSPNIARKKDISWEDKEYQERIILQDLGARSQPLILERRASVGPCFRAGMPFCGPSGITICLPRKSPKNVDFSFSSMPSGINITVSKKNIAVKSKSHLNVLVKEENTNENTPENFPKEGVPLVKFFGVLRGKIDNMRGKIKNVFNM